METFDSDKWERAAILVAQRLASFRLGPDSEPIYNEDDMLRAGHIIGSLWANEFISFPGKERGYHDTMHVFERWSNPSG